MKKIILIICLVFSYYQPCFAEVLDGVKNTTIFVKIVDKDLNEKKIPRINLEISSYPFGGVEYSMGKDLTFQQEAVKEGNTFDIASASDILYMYISYDGKRIPGGLFYRIDNIYILKAGSKLTVLLDKHDIKFSGEGATIPNVQSQIIKHSYRTSESDLKLLNDKEYFHYFQKLDKSRDSALQLQLKVIEENKSVLGERYVKLLTANCYGYRYYSQLRGYNFHLIQDKMFFKAFKAYYNEKIKKLILPEFTNNISDASPMFANYLIEELNVVERIGHEEYGPMLPDTCIKNILQKINTTYNGILKDKLLTLFALRIRGNENAEPFFAEILSNVNSKKYNDLLISKIKVRQNGIPFKDFSLEDERGMRYTLDSFKNKIIVLDFWFTGCENCVILNEAMKPIMKYFSNNNQIRFVSVSIDKSKNQWRKSLERGDYTHHESLNLYTNGKGAEHSLINYYNVTSYPTVFIIKDGLMYSSLPPTPSLTTTTGQEFSISGARFIQLLEKAMK